jgi:hypothetical protein
VNARELATTWLIEHNHHGCHIDVDPSADMPLPTDVDSLAMLLEREPGGGTPGIRIEVHVIGTRDEPLSLARLMVNGFGVATWPAWSEVGRTESIGRDYAEECARVLRKALGVVVENEKTSA